MSQSNCLYIRSLKLFNVCRLNGEFITTVQQRGAAIIKARKLSSALSAASSACDHIRDWVLGTPEVLFNFEPVDCLCSKKTIITKYIVCLICQGTFVSMGVYSDGSYNVPAGLIYSFPVTCRNGEWSIVQGIHIFSLTKVKTKCFKRVSDC